MSSSRPPTNISSFALLLVTIMVVSRVTQRPLGTTYTRRLLHEQERPTTLWKEPRPAYCPTDITNEQCRAMIPPHAHRKTVLVTGGAGFIGSHVAEYLLSRGDSVVIVDEMNDFYNVKLKEANLNLLRKSATTSNLQLNIYRGNICNVTLLEEIFNAHSIQWVCHMAARAGVRPSIENPFQYIESNIKGTTTLMEFSHKYRVRNFVFASSSSVYGGSKSRLFSENEVVDSPISQYAASKKAAELISFTYHHLYDLHITALRFFTVYGPRGRPDMAPFKFIHGISSGTPIQQFGNGKSSRDYTYISDIVDGIVRALDRPQKYEIINLGRGSGTVLKDFIRVVEKYTNKTAVIDIVPDQPGDVPYTCANVTKAHLLLGYESKVSIDEGIRKTVEWYNKSFSTTMSSREEALSRRTFA